ncbi:MAG: T9SS type A sorting domain-containing protein [Bacteroidetes bacterium]|nr:T9SS type A sorting domain-containing protein [Bacteroidota bacterium]
MKKLLGIGFLFFLVLCLQAQELAPVVIASAGKDVSNGGKRMAFTVGELVVSTESNGNYTLTQGFHQPPSLYFTSVRNDIHSEISIHLFPNPTSDIVNVSIRSVMFEQECRVDIYNLYGQKVYPPYNRFALSNGENISIDLSEMRHGAYFIRIFNPTTQKQYTDFKVIKLR